MRRMKMRIGKISTLIAQFTRPLRVVNAAASELKVGEAESGCSGSKVSKTIAVFGAAAGLSSSCSSMACASGAEAEHGLECPCYPWPHIGSAKGLQIFQDICSSCHSMSLVSYRKLVEEETKAIAADIEVVDDEDQKSARLPYPPADLSLITKARLNDGFSLLTGYPAGVKIRGGLHQFQYNPYNFNPMPKMLIAATATPSTDKRR